jgi:hypothetical protein
MRRLIVIIFLTILWLALPKVVPAIEGLPGSTWGDLHGEFPHPGDSDAILEGWIRQGIGWKRWNKGTKSFLLNTYVTARYKWDSRGYDYNNYLGPGVGASIDMYAPEGPVISWGVEHIYQINYRSGDDQPYTALFMNWYYWWNIREKKYPGSTWGDLRYEVPNSGKSNLILEGWLRQGIVLKRWEKGRQTYVLNPYLGVRYKVDTEGFNWNNYLGPSVGIAVDMESAKGPLISLGVEYNWEKNLRSGPDINRVDVFMRWYAWWDLLKK